MISSVRTFCQAGSYKPASSSLSLTFHDSDQIGHDVCSPMQESGPVVPQESMVKSSELNLSVLVTTDLVRDDSGGLWS